MTANARRIGLAPFARLVRSTQGRIPPRPFFESPRSQYRFAVSGTTKNGAGVALPNCVVKLFSTQTDEKICETTSDGSGNFTANPPTNSGTYWIAAFDPSGTPAGVTVNTLVAA